MFDDPKTFQHALINILDTLLVKQSNMAQRYLLDTTAKEWGRLVYTTVILAHPFFPVTLVILTRALTETRTSYTDSYMRSIEQNAYTKETTDWFVETIFFPTLEKSSSRQTHTDGRQFVNSEEETFSKNLLLEFSEFRTPSEIAQAIDDTQRKWYGCRQDRAQAIRAILGI